MVQPKKVDNFQTRNHSTEFYCSCCGEKFIKQKSNFSVSRSPIYQNSGYLPVCKKCCDDLFYHYVDKLGSEEEAVRRMCMLFDIYYSDEILKASTKKKSGQSLFFSYISRANLLQYRDKTYDNTIEDEKSNDVINNVDEIAEKDPKITQRTVKFFGTGFTPDDYKFLQDQYNDWTARHECKTKAQEELFKTICMSQLNILKSQQSGVKVNEAMKAFQDLLGSANLKPNQTNDNALADQNTFGTLIKKWENEKPIPEPEPEWKDVDGIVKYITVYFLGHLCKMMGIKNSYAHMYEEEMKKYRVDKPEYDDETDSETLFDSVFNKAESDK